MVSKPVTDTMSITDARANLSELVNEVYRTGRRVSIEKSGLPVAALVSRDDLEQLVQLEITRQQALVTLLRHRAEAVSSFAGETEEEIMEQAVLAAREARSALFEERPELYGRTPIDSSET